jgi:hypothetical protein
MKEGGGKVRRRDEGGGRREEGRGTREEGRGKRSREVAYPPYHP